jgi:DNA-binding beta-propeller fold protein YncE
MNRGRANLRSTRRSSLDATAIPTLLLLLFCLVALPGVGPCSDTDYSDQNRDGVIDIQDLTLYSERVFGQNWEVVDWCRWLDQPPANATELRRLRNFVQSYFDCNSNPLEIVSVNKYPTRVAWGPGAQRLYVSDARTDSVFIYDAQLEPIGEIKELGTPLGIAVGPTGDLYVGNNRFDNVEVYSPDGTHLATLGVGAIRMPNDLAFDANGVLYVADSKMNRIWVFDPATEQLLREIGAGTLRFPSALAIAGQELFVADQLNHMVRVFDLDGNLLRSLGGEVTQGSLGYKWQGKFVRLQSLAVDAAGRLHVLDSQMSAIQLLDAVSGDYLGLYGTRGTAPGELNLPLDIALNAYGELAVANTKNERVELLTPP